MSDVYTWANVHWFPLSIAAMLLIGSIMTAIEEWDSRRRRKRLEQPAGGRGQA